MPTEGSIDHVSVQQAIPTDVLMAIDDGNLQIRHMEVSKFDHASGLIKLTPRQYIILRDHIYALHNRR